MFDLLSIDWGSVRYGLSFADSKTQLILPDNKDRFTKNIERDLEILVYKYPLTTIVLGMPTTFNYKPTDISLKIASFAKYLEYTFPSISIVLINERGTTNEYKYKNLQNPHTTNHLAASSILERYFLSKSYKDL
jgi:RNase H-fold protein (predicted Holliday junction resolvase)